MNIIYATNDRYVHLTAVSIKSLLVHNPKSKIYVMYVNLKKNNIKKLLSITEAHNIKLELVQVSSNEVANLPNLSYFSFEAYLRLFITNYMNFDKALYIDGDTLIRNSLKQFYETDIDDHYLGARTSSKSVINRKIKSLDLKNGKYFNSGVLLLNLKLIKEHKIFQKCLNFIQMNPHLIELPDQDALNKIIDGKYLEIDYVYNDSRSESHEGINQEETVIAHFIGRFKPDIALYKHIYKEEFIRYYKSLPFYTKFNYLSIKKNTLFLLQKIKRKFLKE